MLQAGRGGGGGGHQLRLILKSLFSVEHCGVCFVEVEFIVIKGLHLLQGVHLHLFEHDCVCLILFEQGHVYS